MGDEPGTAERQQKRTVDGVVPQATTLGSVPGKQSRVTTDLVELENEAAVTTETPQVVGGSTQTVSSDDRRSDLATISKYEQQLIGRIANSKLTAEQRKAALRDLVCSRRGIDYPRLAAGDPQRAEIDREIELRYADIATQESDAAIGKKLDARTDNLKLARTARLAAFYQKYLLGLGIRNVANKSTDEQTRLRATFDATELPQFELRDQVIRDRAKQRSIIKNRGISAAKRLAAYRDLFRGQYVVQLRTAWAALKPDQQAAIDQRFDAEVKPQFDQAEAAYSKQLANAAKAKTLEARLRPVKTTTVFTWGKFTAYQVPEEEATFRQILVLRTGLDAGNSKIATKVTEYRQAVQRQNAATAKAKSAAFYFDRGVQAMNRVTKADIAKLWPATMVEQLTLADAMFPEAGMPPIAPAQRTPILIRAGALLYGGEQDSVVEQIVARGSARIADLTRPIILITEDVLNRYLDRALLSVARSLLTAGDQGKLQDAVLRQVQEDRTTGVTTTLDTEAQVQLATTAIGPNPVTVDGAPVKLGDKTDQAATISWTQSVQMKAGLDEAQAAVDAQQKIVDDIKTREAAETKRMQTAQAERLKNNPRLLNQVGVGPGYVDPKRAEAEAELQKRKAQLQRGKEVQASFTEQAMQLKTGQITYEQVQQRMVDQITKIDNDIAKYEQELAAARIRAAATDKRLEDIRSRSMTKDRGSGSELGDAISDSEAQRKVRELGEHIIKLRTQRSELDGYQKAGTLAAPIRIQEIQKSVAGGYEFVSLGERWGRAALAGVEDGGAFLIRVFAGIVDVSIPGLVEKGGNGVLGLLGSDARLNFGIGWATGNLRKLSDSLAADAEAQVTIGGKGFDVDIIRGLTSAAVLILPTMGFGSVGAAIGGAIRATQMAQLLGTSVSLGTMGVLASLDKGPGDMLRTAVPMAGLPLFGAAFKSIGGKLIAAFFSNMTSDVLVSANYAAAADVLKRGGTTQDAITAAGSTVDFSRALANGILGVAMEAHGVAKAQNAKTLVEDGMPILARQSADGATPVEYYQYKLTGGGGEWVVTTPQQALAVAGKQSRPPVQVSAAELATIKSGGDTALQAVMTAEQRTINIDAWGRAAEGKQAELTAIDQSVLPKTEDTKARRTLVASELEQARANEQVMRLSAARAEIDGALVERAGQAPLGYAKTASGKWTYSAELAQKTIAANTAEAVAVDGARASYERELAQLYRLREQLEGKGGKKQRAEDRAITEEQLAKQSEKVRISQQEYLAIGGDPSLAPPIKAAIEPATKVTDETTKTEQTTTTEKPVELSQTPEQLFESMFKRPLNSGFDGLSPQYTLKALQSKAAAARAKYPELAAMTDVELMALIGYTSADSVDINKGLRGQLGTNANAEAHIYSGLIESAMAKLPDQAGTFRRVVNYDAAILAQFEVGKVVAEPGFSSASRGTVDSLTGNTIIEIRGTRGKDIDFISTKTGVEREVLFPANTAFRVDSIESVGGKPKIVLVEVAGGATEVIGQPTPKSTKPAVATPGADKVSEAARWADAKANTAPKLTAEEAAAELAKYEARQSEVRSNYEQMQNGTLAAQSRPDVTAERLKLAVEGNANGDRIPLNYKTEEQYRVFQAELQEVFVRNGITDAVVQQLGSATTGWRGNPAKDIKPWSTKSDSDFAIFSEQALVQAQELGVPVNEKIKQGGKFTVLKNECGPGGCYDTPLGQDLKRLARKWNQLIYGDPNFDGFDFKLNLTAKPFGRAVSVVQLEMPRPLTTATKPGATRAVLGTGAKPYFGVPVQQPKLTGLIEGSAGKTEFHIAVIKAPELASLDAAQRAELSAGIDLEGAPRGGNVVRTKTRGHRMPVDWAAAQALRKKYGLEDDELVLDLTDDVFAQDDK